MLVAYNRTLPRDFFNEAKLLSNLGRLELLILEKRTNGVPLKSFFEGGAFNVEQDEADGSLRVTNYKLFLNDEEIYLSAPYNSKDRWVLMGMYKGAEYYLFDDNGNIMPNFGHHVRG